MFSADPAGWFTGGLPLRGWFFAKVVPLARNHPTLESHDTTSNAASLDFKMSETPVTATVLVQSYNCSLN